MSKDTTKNLVGQPIFKQVMKILPREQFDLIVNKCGSDRYYKSFFSWDQLVVMLFGIFSRCDSMGEVCDGMRALAGKLNYLGMDSSPSKSTAGDALRDRENEVFKLYYFALRKYFEPLLSVSRKEKISFEKFYAFDSTTITLFSDVMKGVGRNPKGDGKKKGGLKVHMLTDVHADTAVFAKISEAKMHDKKFLQHLNPSKGSMLVFDKAYNYYRQFADWTEEGVYFVCRLKDNAKTEVQELLFEKLLEKDEYGVSRIEHIHLKYKKEKQEKTVCPRLVYYRDEQGRKYKFITNNWDITAEEVALIYKYRWTIGVSREGHIIQSVKVRPGIINPNPVAWEALLRKTNMVKPSDKVFIMENEQYRRLQRTVNAEVASLHAIPVAETVYNARRQQGLTEKGLIRQFSPAGYQRWHVVKNYVETGEALDTRRRNIVEEAYPITLKGKWGCRYQGGGLGRSTVDRCAAKRTGREGPRLMSISLNQREAEVK